MTLLSGDPNFTGYSPLGPLSTDGTYLSAAPYIAQYTGLATSLNCWITPSFSGQQFQMGLYDGVSQRLASSGLVTVNAPGPVNFPISATPQVSGRAYQLALSCVSGPYQFGIDSTLPTNAFLAGNGQYPLPFQLNAGIPSGFPAPAYFVDGDSQANTLVTSGAVGNFLDTGRIISRAFNRAKIPSIKISDELVQTAKDELYLILIGLANGPTPLWAIKSSLLGMTAGSNSITMPYGTVDVKNVNFRQMSVLQSSASTVYSAPTTAQVTTISITWSGPAMPFVVLYTTGAITTQALAVSSPNAQIGQTSFYDMAVTVPASQWQVIGSNIGNVAFYTQEYEIPMYGYSRDEWNDLPNKDFMGSPRQFWFDRQTIPVMNLWATPQLADQNTACLSVLSHMHIQDVGQLSEKLDIPQRWQPAIIDMLAESLARHPEAPAGALAECQLYAEKNKAQALGEEREQSSIKIMPDISGYTR